MKINCVYVLLVSMHLFELRYSPGTEFGSAQTYSVYLKVLKLYWGILIWTECVLVYTHLVVLYALFEELSGHVILGTLYVDVCQ